MAMPTGAMLRATGIRTVGLCHSVQSCAEHLLKHLGMPGDNVQWNIAGINHMAWLLSISRNGEDLYPEIKKRAAAINAEGKHWDMVRFDLMSHLGYYITESSEHNAEYNPFYIKAKYPELIDRFNIPLDEYPRRCIHQIADWATRRETLVKDASLNHERTEEYASYIMEAMETDIPYRIGGNVLNKGLIDNLPSDACVEVACMVDRNGVQPTKVGRLPVQCAAMNMTSINVQLLTIEAALTGKKEHIYQAAMLDPHTAAELSIDDIKAMCDDLIEAHGSWLPQYH
jgi:alpha-galactosidase